MQVADPDFFGDPRVTKFDFFFGRARRFFSSWSIGRAEPVFPTRCAPPPPVHEPQSLLLEASPYPESLSRAVWHPLLLQIRVPMRASPSSTPAYPHDMPAPPAVRVVRPLSLAQQRASDLVNLQAAVAAAAIAVAAAAR